MSSLATAAAQQLYDKKFYEWAAKEYVKGWDVYDILFDDELIDGHTHEEIRRIYESNQRGDSQRVLTSAQKAWAREDWSAQLRAKAKL